MKTKRIKLHMTLALALMVGCAFVAVCSGGQAAQYIADQEGKQVHLAKAKEDMVALRSCLAPCYKSAAKLLEITASVSDVAVIVPSAAIMPSIVKPDSTAIAASPRSEIKTGPEEKK
jgi:hypothetical protein